MSELEIGGNHTLAENASGALELVSNAARQGAIDAREAAAKAWDRTGLFLARFAYTSSYTLSYGVVFPATMLALAIPRDNAAVRGLVDGARAAMGKVDEIRGDSVESEIKETLHAISPS